MGGGELQMSKLPIPSRDSNAITVLCAGAMGTIMAELSSQFEKKSGKAVSLELDRSGVVRDRVQRGEAADVVITTRSAIDELAGRGRVIGETVRDVGRSTIGIAIRRGQKKPDLSSSEDLKQVLLNAQSIACADPATGSPSGIHFIKLIDQLGIAAVVAPRLKLVGAGVGSVVIVCEAVARGEADIGIQQIAEILPIPEVELAGPLPDELQQVTVFSIALGSHARDSESALGFIKYVTSSDAASVIVSNGMVPA